MSLISEKIQNFDYYINKLPLYLQNSEGFISHFKIWFDLLVGNSTINGVIPSLESILSLINIFDKDYLQNLENLFEDYNENESDFLDKLGSIFNVSRNFRVKYNLNGEDVEKDLSLNNKDFLLLIRAQVIKNYSNGTFEQMREFYDDAELSIVFKNNENSAIVDVYLLYFDDDEADSTYGNIRDMFYAELLTIKSMGIQYRYSIQRYYTILIWDSDKENNAWGLAKWAI